MTRALVIEGSLVKVTDTVVTQQIPLADFISGLETKIPLTTPIMPRNAVRMAHLDQSDTTRQKFDMVCEIAPKTIGMTMARDRVYRLAIPYTRWLFQMQRGNDRDPWGIYDIRLFWAKQAFTDPGLEDMIVAKLPNIYRDTGSICFGNTAADAAQNMADRLDQTMNEFYSSTFNRDLTIVYPNGWTSWTPWENMTLDDPLGWNNWSDWQGASNGSRGLFSVNSIFGDRFDRSQMRMSADPIPAIPLTPSFGRVQEWLTELTPAQRIRLREALNGEAEAQ